ncbi:uncharacterized protein Z519_10892 [Cladophialophora bantiana CBS 173.52]|uniref:MARVEL domain-containing protein n=1 Tax=Cladophialophora bantiana (strain ATCC 10958 / CBS 173.52 / CDC B-1940 / NIH 8579) TaxID=1442370 RepID=A0A0D2HBM0_CLAB1|nr:uncharacterized protein Z519_10892 [Cladophialophora bantiana CBS 173.52]KIW88325.1 hypothetical protein Z519_10892 [Cladophialophora bantiana CBS 173.52]
MEPLRHLVLPNQQTARQHGITEHAPTHEQFRKAQGKARAAPNICRVLVRFIALGFAASIIGVLAHAAVVWATTRNVVEQQSNGIRQRAWPNHIDVWPTWVMLGAAVFAVVVQILSLLTFCGGTRRLREMHLHTWAVFFTSLLGIAAWIAAAVYFKWQDNKGNKSWDLWSWSCTHKSLKNGKMSFETMCVEMKYTFYASIVVAVFEIASLAVFGYMLVRRRKGGPGYSKINMSQT